MSDFAKKEPYEMRNNCKVSLLVPIITQVLAVYQLSLISCCVPCAMCNTDPFASIMTSSTVTSSSKSDALAVQRAKEKQLGQSSRELNPFWKDGGSGVPPTLAQHAQTTTPAGETTTPAGHTATGWRARAKERIHRHKDPGPSTGSGSTRPVRQETGSTRAQDARRRSDTEPMRRPTAQRNTSDATWGAAGSFLGSSTTSPASREVRHAHRATAHAEDVKDTVPAPSASATTRPHTDTTAAAADGDDDYAAWAAAPPTAPAVPVVPAGAEEGSDAQTEESSKAPPPTDAELNAMAADLMRAEMMGDDAEVRVFAFPRGASTGACTSMQPPIAVCVGSCNGMYASTDWVDDGMLCRQPGFAFGTPDKVW